MNSLQFVIDEDRCIRCGECVLDCPLKIINIDDDVPFIKPVNEKKCIHCQHCLAVCPTGAVSIFGINPDKCVPASSSARAEQTDALIRNRRTVRRFRQENVPADKLEQLIKTASNAPTGENHMGVTLNIIDDIDQMKIFKDKVTAKLEEMDKAGTLPKEARFFAKVARAYRMGNDVMFRGAPHLIVASARKDSPAPYEDAMITLSYLDIAAYSMGLGTVWVNFLMNAFYLAPELTELLSIPTEDRLVFPMLLGVPDVTYHRGVKRDDIRVNRITLS